MNWHYSTFDDLSSKQLYDILKLRQDIFIIEQDCIYPDMDGSDVIAHHLMGYEDDKLVAYLRVFEAGIKFDEASIGRIVIPFDKRGTGLGEELVREGIKLVEKNGSTSIRIEAQAHLDKFYARLGFVAEGDVYVVDGIDHFQMLRASGQ